MNTPTHCSAPTLAKLLSLSERRIRQLASEGIIPKVKTGQYDIVGSIRGYLHYIHQHDEKNSSAYQREKTRLTKVQADQATLSLERDQGKLLCAITVEQVWTDSLLHMRSILLNCAQRLTTQIMSCAPLQREQVNRCVQAVMEEALEKITDATCYPSGEGDV